jgi:hypothetical protein
MIRVRVRETRGRRKARVTKRKEGLDKRVILKACIDAEEVACTVLGIEKLFAYEEISESLYRSIRRFIICIIFSLIALMMLAGSSCSCTWFSSPMPFSSRKNGLRCSQSKEHPREVFWVEPR